MMPVPAGAARSTTRPAPVAAVDVVMQGAPVAQRHVHHGLLGGLGRLADRFGHLARLAVAEPDPALLVADHHKGGETEAPATLDHLGDTVDVHQAVYKLAVAISVISH